MKLSVITIAYNNLKGLEKTLALFMDGRFAGEIEHVIVDGGSNDGSREFLQHQTLTTNWVSEKDKGIYNAMNKGLSMAHGDYVWFLNSGDFAYSREVVDNVLKTLEQEPDALYGETMMVDAGGKELGTRSFISTRKLPDELNWKSFNMGMNVGHQSFVIRRELALPYDEKYRYVADIDWMISCLKHCRTVVNLRQVIACFAVEGFSASNRQKSNKERYEVLKKHYGWLPNVFNHLKIMLRKFSNPSRI